MQTADAKPRPAPRVPLSDFDRAERDRQALENTPQPTRTKRDYERVLNEYRAIYHANPANIHADSSVVAVADLLAEQGRNFNNPKSLRDAIGQYEFLRREYPYSKYRAKALMEEGEIFSRDLHDPQAANATFQSFLQQFPHHQLADQVRAELTPIQPQKRAPARKTTLVAPPLNSVQASVSTEFMRDHQPGDTPEISPPASPPPGKLPRVTGIRHWSTSEYTRVAIDLENEVQFEAGRVTNPDRIFFDLHGTRLAADMKGKSFDVQDDGFLSKIRVAQFSNDMTRVVLNVSNVSDYAAFLLPNPYRLIIDIHGKPQEKLAAASPSTAPKPSVISTANRATQPAAMPVPAPVKLTKAQRNGTTKTHADATPAITQQIVGNIASVDSQQDMGRTTRRLTTAPVVVKEPDTDRDDTAATNSSAPAAVSPPHTAITNPGPGTPAVAMLNPDTPRTASATKLNKGKSTSKPSAAIGRTASTSDDGNDLSAMTRVAASTEPTPTPTPNATVPTPTAKSRHQSQPEPVLTGAHEANPTSAGERSLVRALGLKIGRIVVDAGHGGHDSGTLGVDGIQEKDIVLDVALRLGKLLKQRLGSDVIYTRDTDTFIPLETRTAIANKAQADLFISIHANSSHDETARGVEVYYLNFTASPDALEVAARENAVSQNSIFQLSSLVKQITLRDKIEESHEFASDVDASLFNGISGGNAGLKDRGVKKAPFVVLIGANMPSILAEISFVTNPDDARQLRDPNYRQRIAESLYRGVAKYANGLSGVRLAQNGRGGTNAE
jgi:N-acetylmuramoyl-L-alanine amidase